MLLKKINNLSLYIFLLNIVFICTCAKSNNANNVEIDLLEYLEKTNEFSASFIQSDGSSVEEGLLFIKNKRLRIQYLSPTKILIIISKNKAMYFNQDLEEVDYFNPKKSLAGIFFDIFYEGNFLNNAKINEIDNALVISKSIQMNKNEKIALDVYFEKNPISLRKIKINNQYDITSYSLSNHNYNPVLSKKMFSMANPVLNLN